MEFTLWWFPEWVMHSFCMLLLQIWKPEAPTQASVGPAWGMFLAITSLQNEIASSLPTPCEGNHLLKSLDLRQARSLLWFPGIHGWADGSLYTSFLEWLNEVLQMKWLKVTEDYSFTGWCPEIQNHRVPSWRLEGRSAPPSPQPLKVLPVLHSPWLVTASVQSLSPSVLPCVSLGLNYLPNIGHQSRWI